MFNGNRKFARFLTFGNAKDHQTLLNFPILAGKWQKTHLFI